MGFFLCKASSEPGTTQGTQSQHLSQLIGDLSSGELRDFPMEINAAEFKKLQDLVKNMSIKFHDQRTTKDEKMSLLTLLPSNWTVPDKQKVFPVSEHIIKKTRDLQLEKGLMVTPNPIKGNFESVCIF